MLLGRCLRRESLPLRRMLRARNIPPPSPPAPRNFSEFQLARGGQRQFPVRWERSFAFPLSRSFEFNNSTPDFFHWVSLVNCMFFFLTLGLRWLKVTVFCVCVCVCVDERQIFFTRSKNFLSILIISFDHVPPSSVIPRSRKFSRREGSTNDLISS